MAAIIAQMTRANRERKKRKRREIKVSKCMYHIPPFPERFEPQLHNKYFRAKRDMKGKRDAERFHKDVLNRLEYLKDEEERNRAFSGRSCAVEGLIIGTSLLVVPLCVICVLWFWPETVVVRTPFSETDDTGQPPPPQATLTIPSPSVVM